MPCGLLIKYGFYNNLVNGSNIKTFDTAANIPVFTSAVLYAGVTTQSAGVVNYFVGLGATTTTTIEFLASQRTSTAPLVGNASATYFA